VTENWEVGKHRDPCAGWQERAFAAEAERDRLIADVQELIAMNERMTDEAARTEERLATAEVLLADWVGWYEADVTPDAVQRVRDLYERTVAAVEAHDRKGGR